MIQNEWLQVRVYFSAKNFKKCAQNQPLIVIACVREIYNPVFNIYNVVEANQSGKSYLLETGPFVVFV